MGDTNNNGQVRYSANQPQHCRQRLLALAATCIVALLSVGNVPTAHALTENDYNSLINTEANWLHQLQFKNSAYTSYGALPESSCSEQFSEGTYCHIEPYWASLAALGLLESNSAVHTAAVRNFIEWYFNHINWPADYNGVPGTIYNHWIAANGANEKIDCRDPNNVSQIVACIDTNGDGRPDRTASSKPQYDSTDATAATFLSVILKYCQKTAATNGCAFLNDSAIYSGTETKAQHYQYLINLIASAVIATKQTDGLAWATPDYPVKYLMDNAEVYAGLRDASLLYRDFVTELPAYANNENIYLNHAKSVAQGVEAGLWRNDHNWDPNRYYYYSAKFADNNRAPTSWTNLYPDAAAQLWPAWTGLAFDHAVKPSGEEYRASYLYNHFNNNHAGWKTLSDPQQIEGALTWPHSGVAMGIATIRDYNHFPMDRIALKNDIDSYLTSANSRYIASGHRYPWISADAGNLMRVARSSIVSDALLAEWKFNNDGTDSALAGHTATLYNGAGYTTDAHGGGYAVNFDGVNDYVNLGTFNNLPNKFSITMWVKPDSSATNSQTLMANSNTGAKTNGWRLYIKNTGTTSRQIVLETGNGTNTNSANSNVNVVVPGAWQPVAIVIDRSGGSAELYWNGKRVTNDNTILANFKNSSSTLRLGSTLNNLGFLKGKIDNVRLYGVALTPTEVAALASQ